MFFLKNKYSFKNIVPIGFTDIHSHILPEIDDGASNMDETICIIKKYQEQGIHKVIATPHVMHGVWENSSKTILNKLNEVRDNLEKHEISDFIIDAGAEYMLDENFNKLLEKKDILPIKSNKVLVELSYFSYPSSFFDTIFSIQLAGYSPILAHPERYRFYHSNFSSFEKLKTVGVGFQLNLLSITPYYGKSVQKTAFKLLDNDMYDCAGSDIHRLEHFEKMHFKLSNKHFRLIKDLLNKNREIFS